MGARKRQSAENKREDLKSKTLAKAILRNVPTSTRKMRLVAGLIRGLEVNRALDILKHTQKEAAEKVGKLLMSAISNWQVKNAGVRLEDTNLVVKEIKVDEGKTLKRIRPAPQGRAYVIRKRSNHVTIIVDSLVKESKSKESKNKQVDGTES